MVCFVFILVIRFENVNTNGKETQIDHILILKEYDLIGYQQLHSNHFRPYSNSLIFVCIVIKNNFFYILQMQRIRKASEHDQILDLVQCYVYVVKVIDCVCQNARI